jgi:hypothetical protein
MFCGKSAISEIPETLRLSSLDEKPPETFQNDMFGEILIESCVRACQLSEIFVFL